MRKKGDIVTIYQDPITKRKVDGKAQLIRRIPYTGGEIGEERNLEQWELIFLDDGMQTVRLITHS